jgi:predicted Zn-dependent protease
MSLRTISWATLPLGGSTRIIGTVFDVVAAAYGVNTGGAFGSAAGMAYSKEFEAEADYVGLYIMAGAGLEFAEGPKFWRRMAANNPKAINNGAGGTHPSTVYRFAALEQAVAEIDDKKAGGLPLQPEIKK